MGSFSLFTHRRFSNSIPFQLWVYKNGQLKGDEYQCLSASQAFIKMYDLTQSGVSLGGAHLKSMDCAAKGVWRPRNGAMGLQQLCLYSSQIIVIKTPLSLVSDLCSSDERILFG